MRRTLALLGGVGLGVALSQFPEYTQQYVQRLGGAVDELREVVLDFDRQAAEGGLSRNEALLRYEAAGDAFLTGRGTAMRSTIMRYEELSGILARVTGATAYERLQMLPVYFDTQIGGRTLDNFKPAVPVTPEGFAYAGAGLVAGYALVSALITLLMLPFRRRRRIYRSAME